MSASVWKFKLWPVWRDVEHQQWLHQQSLQGLHLRGITLAGLLHRFERGTPQDITYRWDVPRGGAPDHYRQLFEDAGWRRVANTVGWHCWAKPSAAAPGDEIFTDAESVRRKYRYILATLLAVTLPGMALLGLLMSDPGFWDDVRLTPAISVAALVMVGACALTVLSSLWGALSLWRRMQAL